LAEQPDAEVVGAAENGREAVEMIRELRPDLVFLDVQMPRMNGLEVVREIGPSEMPATIFVTGYDRYALQAFEIAAVDYLVKPFPDERFEEAFHRARRRIEMEGIAYLREQLLDLLQGGTQPAEPPESAAAPPDRGYLRRLAVQMRGKMI